MNDQDNFHSEESHATVDVNPPTVSPAINKQTSANLVQTHGEFGGFAEPGADGKSTGEFIIYIVRQPNDGRSEAAIVCAALQDEFEKMKSSH